MISATGLHVGVFLGPRRACNCNASYTGAAPDEGASRCDVSAMVADAGAGMGPAGSGRIAGLGFSTAPALGERQVSACVRPLTYCDRVGHTLQDDGRTPVETD